MAELDSPKSGGHSSLPVRDNAIYRAYFERAAAAVTTCVATRLEGGHANPSKSSLRATLDIAEPGVRRITYTPVQWP